MSNQEEKKVKKTKSIFKQNKFLKKIKASSNLLIAIALLLVISFSLFLLNRYLNKTQEVTPKESQASGQSDIEVNLVKISDSQIDVQVDTTGSTHSVGALDINIEFPSTDVSATITQGDIGGIALFYGGIDPANPNMAKIEAGWLSSGFTGTATLAHININFIDPTATSATFTMLDQDIIAYFTTIIKLKVKSTSNFSATVNNGAITPTKTITPTISAATNTPSPSKTNTPSPSKTITPGVSGTPSPSKTNTPSPSKTITPGVSGTPSPSKTNTPSPTRTITPGVSGSPSPSRTKTPMPSSTTVPSLSPSPTLIAEATATPSPSPSIARSVVDVNLSRINTTTVDILFDPTGTPLTAMEMTVNCDEEAIICSGSQGTSCLNSLYSAINASPHSVYFSGGSLSGCSQAGTFGHLMITFADNKYYAGTVTIADNPGVVYKGTTTKQKFSLDSSLTLNVVNYNTVYNLNKDETVDISDFRLFLPKYGQTTCPNTADFNGDCWVNVHDFLDFAKALRAFNPL